MYRGLKLRFSSRVISIKEADREGREASRSKA